VDFEGDAEESRLLLRWLAERPGHARPPCIAVTAGSDPDAQIEALEHGAADVLRRPFSHAEARAKIRLQRELHQLQGTTVDGARALQQAKDQLERTLYLHKRFLSLVTHDLRTPLTTVKLAVEVLWDRLARAAPRELQGTCRRLLGVVLRNLLRIESNFNEILNIGRLDFETPPLTMGVVDLNRLVREAVGLCVPPSDIAGPAVAVECRPVEPVAGDEQLLQQMVLNLLNLVLCRMDDKDCATVRTAEDNHGVRLDIHDTAPPLDPRYVAEVCRGLERDNPSAQTRVGLYLAHRIARTHHGRLWLECGEDGSTFSAWLPHRQPTR
jgi:two-component system sensor histidine kinase MtrB